ncbi:tyrosinase family protein [Psychrobacter sp. P2G3]|uniref:tyrosinase family protein n=1 Tax=Psychrobacter sp. P2G3 TaxID=1699622 RepID=UPI00082CD7FC|nr:tyrosinase family protein [Psychrobacter sp. P2G3]
MTCRKNVNALTTEEKAAFITAIKLMKAEEYVYVDNPNDEPHVRARYPNITNTYDKYVLDHHIAMYTGTPGGWGNGFLTRNAVYRGPAFLPWQREFIRRFELDLDRLVPGVTLPYWDWASDAANPMNAVVWTNDLMGGNGSGASRVVRSGPFAYDDADPDNSWVIINYLGLPDGGLVRNFGSRRNTPNLPTQADIDEIQQISTYDSGNFDTSSVGYRGANEGRIPVNGKTPPPSNTHALVHEWIAGSMMLGTSPNDPVFFLHHCFVDKLWADWQALHPTVPYVPGNTASNNLNGHRLNDELVGLGTLISATLDHHAMGYSYDTDTPPIVTPVNTTLVFNDTPVGSTAVQAVTFNISTPTPDNSFCRDLIFTITAGPTGTGFGTPNGDRVVVNRDNTNTAQVWFSYTATSDTDPVTGEAEITSVQTGQTWHISLSANTMPVNNTTRKNLNTLTTAEKAAFINAIKLMKAEEYVYVDDINDPIYVRTRYINITNTYDKYVLDHHIAMYTATPGGWGGNFMNRNGAHRGPSFLPWHREFIRQFELDLARLVPGVTLPYWDWAADAADPMNAAIWANDFMGGNGSGANRVVQSGPFAYDAADLENSWIIINYFGRNDGGLVRNFGSSTLNLPTQADINEIQQISTYDSGDFNQGSVGYRGANEGRLPVNGKTPPPGNTHNLVHEWIAGSMLPGTSPNDPIFFIHHCFVDKLWADWQALHPTVPYVPGDTASNDLNGHRLSDELVGLGVLVSSTLDHHAMGYSYDTDSLP